MSGVIYKQDCLGLFGMQEHVANDSVDVIVTSPPYNIGVKYGVHDDKMRPADYLNGMKMVAIECDRVLSPDGSIFFNIGSRPSDGLEAFEVANQFNRYFHIQNTIHWIKSLAAPEEGVNIGHYKPVNSRRYLHNAHEYIFHFTKSGDVQLDKLAIGVPYKDKSNVRRWKHGQMLDCRDRGNTWFIPYPTVTTMKPHPAAFPIALPRMCTQLPGLPREGKLL